MLNQIRNLSLIKQIMYLILIMLFILLISFVVSNRIAEGIIERKVTHSVEQIMLVLNEKMESFHADMNGISTFLFYSPVVQSYFKTNDELTRILAHKEILSTFFNTISMKENIRGIQMYDTEGRLLARTGEGDNVEGLTSPDSLHYTGLLKLETRPLQNFYAITVPIYGLDSNRIVTYIKGTGRFYMDVSNLAPILESAKITPNSQVMLLDNENNTIAREGGQVKEGIFDINEWTQNPQYIVQTFTLPHFNWTLVSIIPRQELFNDLDMIKRFNVVTYILIFAMLCLFLVIFFNRILKPIRSLLDFVKSYPKMDENRRFQVMHYNEIGVLGTSLNKMLDEISYLSQDIQAAQRRMYEIELSKKQMEVSAFRNQINPHFLYNTLESIRAVAHYYGVNEIVSISESLSNMFRYGVKANDFVTVEDEIAHVQEYARIVDFRFRGRFRIKSTVQDDLYTVPVLKLILQPLVENAVFHGLERKIGKGSVQIEVKREKEGLIGISIKDNGVGMDEARLLYIRNQLQQVNESNALSESSGTGIGMLNIYRRIKLFYGVKAEMTVDSTLHKGTQVTVIFPEESRQV